jgi:hypothetical protein
MVTACAIILTVDDCVLYLCITPNDNIQQPVYINIPKRLKLVIYIYHTYKYEDYHHINKIASVLEFSYTEYMHFMYSSSLSTS